MTAGVALVVVSHSEPLARAAVALAREMASEDAVRIEVAAGTDDGTGTDAARIMAALESCSDAAGVLVLLDLGSAVLSTETALDLLADPDLAGRVVVSPAPLVEGLVVAAVAAAGGLALADVAAEAAGALTAKAAHLGGAGPPASDDRPALRPDDEDADVVATFDVLDPQGLHARPVARLVAAVADLDAEVTLRNRTSDSVGAVPADSPLAVMTLGAQHHHELEVRATGPDAQAAVDRLLALATDAFGEPH